MKGDKNIIFQISEWREPEQDWRTFYKNDDEDNLYNIQLYGRTKKNKTINVTITGFNPYFYFEIPLEWTKLQAQSLMAHIKCEIEEKFGSKIIDGFVDYDVIERKKFYGFTANKYFKFIKVSFTNTYTYAKFVKWINETEIKRKDLFKESEKLKLYESKIKPFLRCMHIRKLQACGWIKIKKNKYTKIKDKNHTCHTNITVDWNDLNPYENNNKVQKFVEASFDIETMGLEHENCPVIQIGTSFSYTGEDEPFYNNIITLGKCENNDDMKGIDCQSYETEMEVLLAWTKLIEKQNPDILYGYNIDGFDFEFMVKRARKFNIETSFLKLGKNLNGKCVYEEKDLGSSSMGSNVLKHVDINGRIICDVMKYLQCSPTINLSSYKLDFALATFIKESINSGKGDISKITHKTKTNTSSIYTSSIYNIVLNQEIYLIYVVEGVEIIDSEKYKIIEIISENCEKDSNENNIYKIRVEGLVSKDLLISHPDLKWKRNIQYEYDGFEENDNITEENDNITEENDNITEENDNITEENDNITEENDNITEENDFMKENKPVKLKKKIKSSVILTKSTYGIYENQYINIMYNDGLTDNIHDVKYKINKIIKEPIIVTSRNKDKNKDDKVKLYQIIVDGYIPENIFEHANIVNWCNAKDDLSPNTMFKYQKGTDAERTKIAKYCIAEGESVTLENYNVAIESLDNCQKLYGWNNKENGLKISEQVKFFDNGSSECVELEFLDGTTLTCTNEHKILTSNNEWIEAKNIIKNEHKIQKGILHPLYNLKTEINECNGWKFMNYSTETIENYTKTLAFMRILGLILSDGCLTKERATIYVRTIFDANSVIRDLELICNVKNLNYKQKLYTYDIHVPRILSKMLLKIDGIMIGNRMDKSSSLPTFITEDNCPKYIVRDFLRGLFGGDGNTNCMNYRGNKFTNLGFSQSKNEKHLESLKKYIKNIQILLKKLNINSNIHNPRIISNKNNIKKYSICMNIPMNEIAIFEKNIGFAYCVCKTLRLNITSSYFTLKNNVIKQNNLIVNEANRLYKMGNITIKNATTEAYKLLDNCVIYNKHYSFPNYKSVAQRIQSKHLNISNLVVNHKKFPSPLEYINSLGATKFFKKNNVAHCYALDKNATVISTYNIPLINKKNVGVKKIYDIEVKNEHSYIVNGYIVHNCIQDCVAVTKLVEKLKIITNAIGMANVCHVPLSYIFYRGQTIKICSLVSKECRDEDTLIPTLYSNDNDKDDETEEDKKKKGYEGATVFEPKKGVHYEPIVVLDYRSLYPRSMKMVNISHEMCVEDEKYLGLEDYEYYTTHYNNKDGTSSKCTFAKNKNGELGIVPKILTKLLDKRDEVKGMMKTADNDFLKNIFDGLQLAYKVTANSLYGQVGYEKSSIYYKDLAASTTATGRKMLQIAKNYVERNYVNLVNYARHNKKKYLEYANKIFGLCEDDRFVLQKKNENGEKYNAYSNKQEYYEYLYEEVCKLLTKKQKVLPKIIYGDSVTADTPILLRNNNKIFIKTIETINNEWKEYNNFKPNEKDLYNKEQNSSNTNYEVWSNNKWTKIKRVIRHKTNKKIYRVNTHQGIVDVTEDHSLMDENLKQIKPLDCNENTKLLQSYPKFNKNKINISELVNKIINFDLYDISIKNAEYYSFGKFVDDYDNSDNNLNINSILLNNECYDSKLHFLIGYCSTHFNCFSNNSFIFSVHGKTKSSQFYYLMKSLGYSCSIKIHDEKYNVYHLTSYDNENKNYICDNKILNMTYLRNTNNNEYVYDLETEEGIFNAGIGEIIVKNTDSIFFTMKIHDIETKKIMIDKEALRLSIEFGILAGESICKLLPIFQELAYEKTMWPLILIAKKKYVGNLYEEDFKNYILKCMGIVLKRRDNAKIVKIVVGGIVNYILNERSDQGAIDYTRRLVKKILRGGFNIDKFILSKTLKKDYKNRNGQAHAVLADRIAKRDPGNKPNPNDRIPFVFFVPEVMKKKMLQGDKVEDPTYLLENKLEINYLHYITNQIMKPSLQFLEIITKHPNKIFDSYIEKEKLRIKNKMINNLHKKQSSLVDIDENIVYDVKTPEKKTRAKKTDTKKTVTSEKKCKSINISF
jgi:DNA polymerase elongation subunit (family B)